MVEGSQLGAYRVVRQIGVGGMGSVWLAEHVALGRRAAIKVLHPEYSHRPEIVNRFFNEARAATSISDPGIVQIFDFGQHTDGSMYIVMELLEGEPLDRRLDRVGALPVMDALRIMRQVASTLAAAHSHRIVHRDLKPENIFLVHDPEVPGGERAKILDFGIAKLADSGTGPKTQTSAVMGTPMYMSPEQCRGAGQVDQRSDVYSLGCVLYALVIGHPPFVAEGAGELIVMHLREAAPVPSSLRPELPPELDRIIAACLAKDPDHRFATASDLAVALGGLLGSSPAHAVLPAGAVSARYPVSAAPTTLSSATGASMTGAGSIAPARRGRGGLIAGLVVGAAAIGGGAVLVTSRGSDSSTAAKSPTGTPPPAPTATIDAAPAVPPPPPPPDPATQVAAPMKALLDRFVAWSRDHAGAPCPDLAALGATDPDPWGHAFAITCTDQPGDQIIGAISAGPDGTPGNADDLASWQLGRDVTALVAGARWVAAAAPPGKPTTPHTPHRPGKPPKPPTTPSGGVQLDENGLPITR